MVGGKTGVGDMRTKDVVLSLLLTGHLILNKSNATHAPLNWKPSIFLSIKWRGLWELNELMYIEHWHCTWDILVRHFLVPQTLLTLFVGNFQV